MIHDLIIRGFDDKIHAQLGKLANQKGVSINSIVKDAVDKWLKQQQSQLPRKHYLVIHSDDDSIIGLIRSMDRLAKEGDLFRCFCAPPGSQSSEILSKLNWYDATIEPYYYNFASVTTEGSAIYQDKVHRLRLQQPQLQNQKNIMKYFGRIIENIAKNSNNKQVCCLDFLINDVAKASLKEALTIEKAYDNNRLAGLTYCTYKTTTLLNSEIKKHVRAIRIA